MNAKTTTPATTPAITWNTLKGHGFETGEAFTFGGLNRKAADAHHPAYIERTSSTSLTLVDAKTKKVVGTFGVATRFWASPSVQAEAPAEAPAEKAPKAAKVAEGDVPVPADAPDPTEQATLGKAKAAKSQKLINTGAPKGGPIKAAAADASQAPAKAPSHAGGRAYLLTEAGKAKTLAGALENLKAAAMLRKVVGTDAKPSHAPLTATALPFEAKTLKCWGACGKTLPAASFGVGQPKVTRRTECAADARDRLVANQDRAAAGLEILPRPKAVIA